VAAAPGKKARLSQRLIGVSADSGDKVELTGIVEGIPLPAVTWLKDGRTLIGQAATVNVIDHQRARHSLVLENIKVIGSAVDSCLVLL
jgi:hypothetical protein